VTLMSKSQVSILFPEEPRSGCVDIWNGYILKDAIYDKCDIPFCPTTATEIPSEVISILNAKAMYNREMKNGNTNFKYNAFIHFYIDDRVFDGQRENFWTNPNRLIELAQHFAGVITIDFSTSLDFPDPSKRWNTFKMRTLGIHTGNNGIPTINNVRWGEEETWEYSFSGLPKHSIYAIGTVASGIHQHGYKEIFTAGLNYFVKNFAPKALIVVGSDKLPIFNELRKRGIEIVTFKSETAKYYEGRKNDE